MKSILHVVTLLVVGLLGPAVSAHDGHVHTVMGTVTARDATHLKLKTPSGEILSIAITPRTTAMLNKRKVTIAEVQVGRRVAVDIGNGEDPLRAGEIRLGAAAVSVKQ